MIESVTITNHLDESITLELARPELTGLAVLRVDGLGPSKANASITELSGIDGGIFNSARVSSRNIVFDLAFVGKSAPELASNNWTIEDSRHLTYTHFPVKERVRIQVNSTNRVAHIYGIVESNEPAIFTDKSGCVISVVCPYPYFVDINKGFVDFGAGQALFEFPFSNDSPTTPLLVFGSIDPTPEKTIVYGGDSSVGFIIDIHAIGAATEVYVIDSDSLETLTLDDVRLNDITGSGIVNGDHIVISTVKGNKYAKLIRGSTEFNIINALGQNPTWFILEKGPNTFAYGATTGIENLEFSITFEITYQGM